MGCALGGNAFWLEANQRARIAPSSIGYGISSSAHVVGVSEESAIGPRHGFLYTAEFGMVKLQDLIVDLPEGFQGEIRPDNINDLGEICGQADGEAILLTPLP